MRKKYINKRKIFVLIIIILGIFSLFYVNLPSNTNSLNKNFIVKNENILSNDIFYKKYKTGIPLSENSVIYFNTLPLKYKYMELLLVNYSDSTKNIIKKNGREIYQITDNGIYDLFAIIDEKEKTEFINLTSYIDVGTEYKRNESLIKHLNN